MNRRGFLKNFGIGATAVVVPTIVHSTSETYEFKRNGLYTEDELNEYQNKMIQLIDKFTHYTNISWREKDATKLPIDLCRTFTEEMYKQYAYAQRYEEYDLFNYVDMGFKSLIKYELLNNEYTRARAALSSWKSCYRHPKDDWMKKTSFDDFNNTFIKLATEVNLNHKIKKFMD